MAKVAEQYFNEEVIVEQKQKKAFIKEKKHSVADKVRQGLSNHHSNLLKQLEAVSEDAKNVEDIEFEFKHGEAKDIWFRIIDPFHLAAHLSKTGEDFIPVENLASYFKNKDATKEYKVYLYNFKSYLYNYSLAEKNQKLVERLDNELGLQDGVSAQDQTTFSIELSKENLDEIKESLYEKK